jgi:hypothetical protein
MVKPNLTNWMENIIVTGGGSVQVYVCDKWLLIRNSRAFHFYYINPNQTNLLVAFHFHQTMELERV